MTGGTKVLSDRIVVRITAEPGQTFLDRMISLVEGANRQKTPNEVALTILLAALTIIFLPVCVTLQPFGHYAGASVSVVILVALLVCLIPTTIGALLSAIGIAGMDRLVQRNVLAMSGRAVEAAGDTQTLLLDKTGTITLGNRMASSFFPVGGHTEEQVAEAAQLASLADETPEGRSIVVLAKDRFGIRQRDLGSEHTFIPFSATTRMSGLDVDGREVRKGAADSVKRWAAEQGGTLPTDLDPIVERISRAGSTPLVVADGPELLGVIELKDVVKQGIRERFDEMRSMGIRTVMITGDNPLTAAAIASEAGVDDFLAEATPENKLELIKKEQEGGKLVAMTGDGTNDAPALAQADVGVAMNTGTTAAKEAGNMVDLDSNPTKLIDIVEIGKQLLITRGALTTFSIANDVAKYFAIIPALFVATYPQLQSLNIMHLHNQSSAVLSAVIFNALVIVALIPLALRGVQLPTRERAADTAAEPVDLRRRRDHRPVHFHQTDRPDPDSAGGLLMLRNIRRAVALSVVLIVLCLAYTYAETGIAQVFFKHQADGSLTQYGSTSIGQTWTGPKWFQGRDDEDNPEESGPTNYGPRSQQLYDQVKQESATLKKEGITPTNGLVTGSGSGIDPDISPADAYAQASAVASANGLSVSAIDSLIAKNVAPTYLGVFGAPYVNVLDLNVALHNLTTGK